MTSLENVSLSVSIPNRKVRYGVCSLLKYHCSSFQSLIGRFGTRNDY